MSIKARLVHEAELEPFGPQNVQGDERRLLTGADHGLSTSVMHSQVAPGNGARRHRHPHAEIFVLDQGRGRFEVDGIFFDAEAGDVVIIPPNAWHHFINNGSSALRHTAIHENARAETTFEDGTERSTGHERRP